MGSKEKIQTIPGRYPETQCTEELLSKQLQDVQPLKGRSSETYLHRVLTDGSPNFILYTEFILYNRLKQGFLNADSRPHFP